MSGSPITPTPPLSPAEMQVLVSRAGLTLNPGQMADLVLAWRQMVGLLALIPRDRPLADDQAFVFRLPRPANPATTVVARAPKSAPPAGRKAAAPAGKKAVAPAGKRATARAGKKVAAPARRKAATPAGKKAATPVGKKAAAPAGKRATTRKSARSRR